MPQQVAPRVLRAMSVLTLKQTRTPESLLRPSSRWPYSERYVKGETPVLHSESKAECLSQWKAKPCAHWHESRFCLIRVRSPRVANTRRASPIRALIRTG